MQLAVEDRGDVKIVRVQEAKLTYPVLSPFFTEVRQLVEAGARKLVIDMRAVSYIDSASISCLMDIHHLLQEKLGTMKLSGLQPRVVSTKVAIDAPTSTVWAVLTTLRSMGEWDDLPDEYSGESLALGSELRWKRVDGGYTLLTVTGFEPRKRLRLSLYGSSWELPPASYDVAYTYSLADEDGRTLLAIEIGDFAGLPHGQDFYDASLEFARTASRKIKDLAEAS